MIAGYAEPSAVIAFGTGTRFGGGADAADFLAQTDHAIAIVSDDQKAAFDTRLGDTQTMVEPIAQITGFNYAKGKRITLSLYRRSAG